MATQGVAQSVPQRFRRGACVYFVGGDAGPVKIGYTSELPLRLRSLRNQSPVPVRLLGAVHGGRDVERAYHSQFASSRLHGEWFERSDDILDELAKIRWVSPLVENIARFAQRRAKRFPFPVEGSG